MAQSAAREAESVAKGHLRRLYRDRDRMMQALNEIDREIAMHSRTICAEQGVAFLRPETVRRMVMEKQHAN